jgi:superfamily II DNA or RNA helicase
MNSDEIKKLLKKDFSYPNINEDDFQNKIYQKREFYYHKIPPAEKITSYPQLKKIRDETCSTNINLQSHQSLLANFINPQTPYKGLLLFHGLGSGKTIAAVSIAENFKDLVIKYGTKIYILVPGPLLKESWKDEIIKGSKETYLKDFSLTMGYIDKNEKDRAMKQAKGLAMQYYKIMSYRGFAKKALGLKISENIKGDGDIQKMYRKNEDGEYERDIAIDKIENLDNTLLIIDEAHHLTGNDWGLAVNKIIKNSKNLRVILLTATPMKNLADDIIELMNFLRPQDDPIDRDLVYTNQKNHLMELKPGGREYFSKMIQGYISYYRGANPYVYAIQKDQGEIPPGILFTPLVRCPMNEFQLSVYKDVIENSDDTLDRRSAAVSNFVFPSYSLELKTVIGVFGREGLNSIKNMLKTNKDKFLSSVSTKFEMEKYDNNEIITEYDKTKSLRGKIFSQPFLKLFSSKFDNCLTNLLNLVDNIDEQPGSFKMQSANGAGTAFIYSNLVKVGIEIFEQVLLANGFLEYREDGLYNIANDTKDYLTGMYYSDYKAVFPNNKFYPSTYITVTGGSEDGADQIPEEKKRVLDNVFSSLDNVQGKYIKFVLGSRVMTEGITIKQIKEIHILDTAYHLGQLMQVIGRGIRFCVHNSIATEENPYPEVKVYRYVVSIPNQPNELSSEEILYQKAEKKYLLVKETERLMKESSIDCALNYNGNVFPSEIEKYDKCVSPLEYKVLSENDKTKFTQCPLTCDFRECIYECYDKKLNLKYYDRTSKFYKKLTKEKIDFSTFTNKLARNEIEYCKEKIKEIYRYRYVYIIDEILDTVKNSFTGEKLELFEEFFVYQALNELIPISENDLNNFHDNIYDKFSVPGYLIYRSKYYIFQPFNQNEDVPMFYRNNYHSDLVNQLSLYQFFKNTLDIDLLTSLGVDQETISYVKQKNEYNFTDVFEYYDKKDEAEYVGIIDKPVARKKTVSQDLEDVFKIRQSRAKILDKKRGTGIPSLKGAVCFSSKDKKFLVKIAKKIGLIDIPTDTRINICEAIRLRLLYLEKYSTEKDGNKKTWMIIPSNHLKYPFPFNLEDRIDYIKNTLQEKMPTALAVEKVEKKNGIFEDVRDEKFIKYELKIKFKPEWEIYKEIFVKLDFILENNIWTKTVE